MSVLNWNPGGGAGNPPPDRNAINDKSDDTKPIVSSVSVCFCVFRAQKYSHTTAVCNNINIDDKGARSPSIQIFFMNLNVDCTNQKKFSVLC